MVWYHLHNIKLCLTPAEERLFHLLTNAAEAYEGGQLAIDPNPPQQSVGARGYDVAETKRRKNARRVWGRDQVPRLHSRERQLRGFSGLFVDI